jgi:hypothetical protein
MFRAERVSMLVDWARWPILLVNVAKPAHWDMLAEEAR